MKSTALIILVVALLSTGCSADATAPAVRSDILVRPEAGSYLTDYWQQPTDIMLVDAVASIRSCGKEYGTRFMYPGVDLKAGDACLVVAGHVVNRDQKALEIAMFARGYDENGVWVAETLDSNGVYGSITFDIEPGEVREFLLHLNPSDSVRTIQVSGGPYKDRLTGPTTPIPGNPNPPPATPVRESEMTRITFSLEWLLENDAEPDDDTVTITFPESWLREPPDIPEDEETVELSVPTRLLMDHNESDDPSLITVTFPDRYFDGL